MTIRTVALALSIAAVSGCNLGGQRSQSARAIQQITSLESEFRHALAKLDTAAMSTLLAAEFFQVSSNTGAPIRDRRQALLTVTEHDSSRPIQSVDADSVVVRIYGSTAVVTGRTIIRMSDKRRTPPAQLVVLDRFTHVWAQRSGGWRLVSNHVSTIQRM